MTDREKAALILRRLERAGWEAFFVGGCVRDQLLGRTVHDWDIATSAPPEAAMSLFAKSVPTGIRHGTVTVIEDGTAYEVTTFRSDGRYLDGRRPERVRFVSCLREDLSRRDFTVNAMAMDAAGAVTDPFGGREDLKNRVIRCVGDPDVRFSEDALRMLRSLRFSAQLEFAVDAQTEAAIIRCAGLCAKLSAERIRDEVEKTLLCAHPQTVARMMEYGLLEGIGLAGRADLSPVTGLPAERTVRWAGFQLACPAYDLRRLRLDRKTVQLCQSVRQAFRPHFSELELCRCVAVFGWETADCVCALNGQRAELEKLRRSGRCVTLSQLAVDGKDLSWIEGPAVGKMLQTLLEHVLANPGDNDRARLLELAHRLS